jgi:glycosyltransferase involved in cell wall biosynthesis
MFSILILTKNEQANLPACLGSVAWCDDVVVLDSFSDDRSTQVAEAWGARVFQRRFDDFGAQRNYALTDIPFKNPWVFHLDADERFNEDLRLECERVIREDQHSAWFIPNRIFFLGKWIPHCTQYPYPQVRLIKLGEVRFAKSGHGQKEDNALRGTGHIQVPYDHFNFSKGIEDWIAKHNRYSSEEAELAGAIERRPLLECFSKNEMTRKRARKSWFTRMPGRPLLKFLYLYIACRGFLDGREGFIYCRLQMMYESMIAVKIAERRATGTARAKASEGAVSGSIAPQETPAWNPKVSDLVERSIRPQPQAQPAKK